MKKLTFGTPETIVPSIFCESFNYQESTVTYPIDRIRFKTTARGCRLEFPMQAGEQIFGLGLQLKIFNLTGRQMVTRVNSDPISATGDSHAPVPFFVSTAGYGIYFDTARYVEFDFGRPRAGRPSQYEADREIAVSTEALYAQREFAGEVTIAANIPAADGVDIYIIEGDTITDIVSQYNMLAGGGCKVPEWGLTPFYRCCSRYSQEQILETAHYLREHDMPVGILGLEPGWQTRAYSCSFVWNDKLYSDPRGMVKELTDLGYHINLWEHCFTHPTSPIYAKLEGKHGDFEVWGGVVPDLSLPEVRTTFAEHHKENVMFDTIDGFKLDECDGSDFISSSWSFPLCSEFPGGMDGQQYHSMLGTLYMKTMLEALDGKPTLSSVRSAGALCAPYPFVLYSDLYDHKDFIRGLATAGFSGILWTPELRDAKSREELIRRMQTIVFSPQCLINGWYCEKLPWLDHDCEDEIRALMQERERLIPKLMAAFEQYHKTGTPPVRALVSDYTNDPETYRIDDEYLFCDDMLVAPMVCGEQTRKVYLPAGTWRDYYSDTVYEQGWIEVTTDNIPVFVKL
jgi:alpha-D-xyloside xylohydrolase